VNSDADESKIKSGHEKIDKRGDKCFFGENDPYKITFNNVLATMSESVLR